MIAGGRLHAAFTLIEFILVMALLSIVMALSAPALSRFFRQRHLEEEATRFVALTEYSRNEAISQGVPMVVWVDPVAQEYGLEPRVGFPVTPGRCRQFTLHRDVEFSLDYGGRVGRDGVVEAAEFAPDGFLELESVEAFSLVDRFGGELVVAQTTNGWGYEILNAFDYANRQTRR